jgi:ATP-dependent DNA ligase
VRRLRTGSCPRPSVRARLAQRPHVQGLAALAEEVAHAVRAHNVVLAGEICCLEPDGRTHFKNLLFRRQWPHFHAFDARSIAGEDLRALPLLEGKRRLLATMPTVECRLLYLDHIEAAVVIPW